MSNSLSNWFHKKARRWGKWRIKGNLATPPLPSLPAVRPSVLTPSSSTITLIQTASPTSTAIVLSFFNRFPFEIRRKILVEAFGKQVVHMHLARGQPTSDPSKMYTDPAYFPHATRRTREIRLKFRDFVSEQNEWTWAGSVCHRATPETIQHEHRDRLCDCSCLLGNVWTNDPEPWCEFWPGHSPRSCFIGVMGWLLSSRQAYAEGIDILYSTNTIHMASTPMILNLPQLLLPQRLNSILSVEMRWYLYPYKSESRLEEFHKIIAATLANLTNVKQLHISIEGNVRPPLPDYPSNDIVNNSFLAPIEAMIQKMPSLQQFNIALPLSMYDEKRTKIKGTFEEQCWVQPGYFSKKERIWRNMPIPHPQSETGSSHLLGYWITLGHMDRRLMFPVGCSMGMGGPSVSRPNTSKGSLMDFV